MASSHDAFVGVRKPTIVRSSVFLPYVCVDDCTRHTTAVTTFTCQRHDGVDKFVSLVLSAIESMSQHPRHTHTNTHTNEHTHTGTHFDAR